MLVLGFNVFAVTLSPFIVEEGKREDTANNMRAARAWRIARKASGCESASPREPTMAPIPKNEFARISAMWTFVVNERLIQ